MQAAAFTPQSFQGAAIRLCAAAPELLHWPPATFWAATPQDLANALTPWRDTDAPLSPADLTALIAKMHEREVQHGRHA